MIIVYFFLEKHTHNNLFIHNLMKKKIYSKKIFKMLLKMYKLKTNRTQIMSLEVYLTLNIIYKENNLQ